MILAVPYNPTLPKGYAKLVADLNRNGRHPNHALFVVSQEVHQDEAFEFAMKVKDQFGRYFAVTVPTQDTGMIWTSNRMFLAAMDALKSYIPTPEEMQEPVMLYFDPTWKITRPRWLDDFQAEYYIRGAPVTFGNFRVKGEKARIEGPVAINSRFLKITKLIDFLPRDLHWREFLAWEIVNNGLQSEAFGRISPAYIKPANA